MHITAQKIARLGSCCLIICIVKEKIFQLQEESSGLCLEREVQDARSHNIVLAPCVNVKGNKGVLETQIWHLANRDHSQEDAPCCSGLMNWNFLSLSPDF